MRLITFYLQGRTIQRKIPIANEPRRQTFISSLQILNNFKQPFFFFLPNGVISRGLGIFSLLDFWSQLIMMQCLRPTSPGMSQHHLSLFIMSAPQAESTP